jgi:threonylcarbamoyladenosine tRNA methylthiotransferase MtaB
MSTFHLINFGCRASQADGWALKRQLLEAGLEEAPSAAESHYAVLNTCTVTAAADAEVRQVVRRIRRANPACRIVVTGCYAQRAPEEIAQLEGVTCVAGNSHRHLLAELLGAEARLAPTAATGERLVQISGALAADAFEAEETSGRRARILVGRIAGEFHFAPVFADDHTRPTLKVQDGCNARCSFCIIPEVRGPSRSLPPEQVIQAVRDLEARGYQEIVLSGINLGSYGRDLGRTITFLGLVERILAETSIPRLRISSIEPMDVTPALIRRVASEPRLAEHFHVPLQSGSDRILRAMNRRYWAGQYAERALGIREAMPNAALGADVMVGFPGETAEDHRASLNFIESLPFTYLHIFPYSARPGTPAASAPAQVNGRVARERANELRAVVAQKRRAFLTAQAGRELSVVTLDQRRERARVALSSNYLTVLLPESDAPPNRMLQVRIGRVLGGELYGYATEKTRPPVDTADSGV